MSFTKALKDVLAPYHLLNHPFYRNWNEGILTKERLQVYAEQYYHHVEAFPRYISATHSLCKDLDKRKILLENLNDEEGKNATPHPELWLQFAEGLGLKKSEVQKTQPLTCTKELIETFFSEARKSYENGLGGLYAYEYQVPEVAETKIKGLKEFYNIHSHSVLSFFSVHQKADVAHREACESLLEKMSEGEQEKAQKSALKTAQALWQFLTAIHEMELPHAA